jgi:hypothetical protein
VERLVSHEKRNSSSPRSAQSSAFAAVKSRRLRFKYTTVQSNEQSFSAFAKCATGFIYIPTQIYLHADVTLFIGAGSPKPDRMYV